MSAWTQAQAVDAQRRVSALERRSPLPEDWHLVGDPDEPAYTGTWVAVAGAPAGYRISPDGTVSLCGTVTTGTYGTSVFTLPVGYRPTVEVELAAVVSSSTSPYVGRVVVTTAGLIVPSGAGTPRVCLAGLRWYATLPA